MFSWAMLAMVPFSEPEAWFGPAKVSFKLAVEGSPFDAEANDVRVIFESGQDRESRIAYFDGTRWHAFLLTPKSGAFQATVLLNGKTAKKLDVTVRTDQPMDRPFVRIDAKSRRFLDGKGRPYWPVGHNLGWQDSRLPLNLTAQLEEMGKNGLNWARIWACSWDGKNPYFSEGLAHPKGRDMHLKVMDRWDEIVAAAAKSGVRFQFVLFHHGMFSTRTDANWNINAWNTANGGFLEKPEEFFTHPEAKTRAKNWLRYAVARWGHEPAILSWELFNEVEWVDAFGAGQGEAVGRWHDEMADYLRSIDPYRRLVTTSSGRELPIWRKMDYHQPHGYPPDIKALVLGTKIPEDKPLFYGEVGLGGGPGNAESERMAVRDGLWSGLMAGHAGAAQYWYWDRVQRQGLYPEFARFTKFFARHKLESAAPFAHAPVGIESRPAGAVQFAPGQGWAKTTQFEFAMPKDAESGALGALSGFIQGPNKRDMMAEPIRFTFESAQAGKFELNVGTIARQGAEVRVLLDGQVKVAEKFAAQEQDRPLNRTFAVEFGPGRHTVTIANEGPDWYMANWFRIDGIGKAVVGHAARSGNLLMLRLGNGAGTSEERAVLTGLNLPDGKVKVSALDLDSGEETTFEANVAAGKLKHSVRSKDAIWLIRR